MYTVYKHTCPNGKVYIGITKHDVTKRWGKNGYGYKKQVFYKAIKKYGWENIQHNILFTDLTHSEACEKEALLIALYKSNNPKYGYNATNGGDGGAGHIVSEEARKMMSQHHKDWSGEKNPNYGRKGGSHYASKKICQYDSNGKFIFLWDSISDIKREMTIDVGNIVNACKGRQLTAGGYVWRYYTGETYDICVDLKNRHKRKRIEQYTKDGIIVRNWDSIKEASKKTGIREESICKCCKGVAKTAGGYIWKYKGDK